MKHLLQYIILCLLMALPFAGCHKHSPVANKLQQAETCMNEYPDSALTILKSISHPERLTGQAQADYALLFSFAQYRCNHTFTSDSLIQLAVQYYKDKDNANRLGTAYYVWGSVLQECNADMTIVIQTYKDAERQAAYMTDDETISRIYSRLGHLNQSSGNYEEAKQYYRQAIAINQRNGKNNSLASNYLNLFRIHYLDNEEDSVAMCTDRLLQLETTLTDSALRSKIHQNIGVYHMYAEDYAKAEQHLTHALQLASDKASPKIWLSLADIYQYSQRQDKADSLYASLASYPDITIRANAYKNILNGLLQQTSPSMHDLFGQYTAAADSAYENLYQAELSVNMTEYRWKRRIPGYTTTGCCPYPDLWSFSYY